MTQRMWPTRSPWVVDVILTVVMLGLGLAEVLPQLHRPIPGARPFDTWMLVAVPLQVAPLLVRRIRPLLSVAAAAAVLWTVRRVGYHQTQIDGPVLVFGFYAAGAFGSRRYPAIVAAAVVAVAVAATFNQPPNVSVVNTAGLTTVWAVAYLVGWAVGGYRTEAVRHREHAQQVVADRELRIEQAVADERNHIARELHDVVAHSLGFIALEAHAGRVVFDSDPLRAREALESVGTAGRQGLAEMRRLLAVLREHDSASGQAPLDPQPMLADLPALAAAVRASGLPVQLELDLGQHSSPPAGVQLSAYRIVQEALTNTIKHAGAANAHVIVRHLGDQLSVEVLDTGVPVVGPYPRPREQDQHVPHGIIGMRERAALYGGVLQAGPVPNAGWRVAVVLPLGDPPNKEVLA